MLSRVWAPDDCPVTQPYGRNHRGIDIGMATGHPLFAARSGVVSQAGDGFVCLTVGDNLFDWYLHISRWIFAVGTHVAAGQLIAFSGAVPLYLTLANGSKVLIPITGPHLHFEVQTGHLDVWETSLDPVPVLLGGGDAVNMSERQAWVVLSYLTGLGRTPESVAARDGWANQIKDDGSNLIDVVAQIINSGEGVAYRRGLAAAIKASGSADAAGLVSKAALKAAIDAL